DRAAHPYRSELFQVGRSGDVKGCLVDRHAQYVGTVPLEDLHQLVGRLSVQRRIGLAHKHPWKDGLGLEYAHPGLDAEIARLAGRRHNVRCVGGVGGDREDSGPWPEPSNISISTRPPFFRYCCSTLRIWVTMG